MKKYRSAVIIFFGFLFPGFLAAQKIDSMMNVYADNYPQEKIHMHFDKSVYNAGETIWFKAYVFIGSEPSLLSKNFYTELSDGDGNILQRHVAPIFGSTASGSFDIPADIKYNRLHLRAYTTWMLNFDTAFIYEKEIPVLNGSKDSTASAKKNNDRFLQFFPEGGDMIAGLENNVAFKATDHFGMPVNVKGILQDASGKKVVDFSSVHDGMGKLVVTPEKNDVFTAIWKDDLGVEHKTTLPPVKPNGVSLKLMGGDKKIFFSVARSSDSLEELKHLTVIAYMFQHIVYKAKINLSENFMSGGTIPVAQLPSGILQVTVFNSLEQPVSERVIFVNNHDYSLEPKLTVTAKSVVKRGRNEIQLYVPDTTKCSFSIAITDADVDGDKLNDDNIVSRLLLTGDIKGYVHNPYFYFSNNSDTVAQYLDLVMMTHGWRRFKWDQLAAGKTPVIKFTDQDYVSAKVDVYGVDASRVSRDESISMIIRKKDSSTQLLQIPRVPGGIKFGITGLVFYDTAQVYYQFNTNRKLSSEAAIVFTNGLYNGNRKIKPMGLPYNTWTAADSALLQRNRMISREIERQTFGNQQVKTLQQVTVHGKERSAAEKLSDKYASGLFTSNNSYNFDLVDDQFASGYPDIFTYLQGKVAGLTITVTGNNDVSMSWRGSQPQVYLNEMPADVSLLKNTPVTDIALVKIFPPGSGIGFGGGSGGTIAVYTKKGGDVKSDESFKGLDKTRLVGYTPRKEFYSPDYAIDNPDNQAFDFRRTLYWSPYIYTDKNNKRITLQFYNTDITKRIRIVLEGINEDGKLARIEQTIQQ